MREFPLSNIITFKNFSDSPRHFEMSVLAEMLKNVTSPKVSEHNALANCVLPTPEAPCKRMPFHGLVNAVKRFGCFMGNKTPLCKICLTWSFPCTSSQLSP